MATKTATKAATFTSEQESKALANARKSLKGRREWAAKHSHNSFSAWGNDKCISRLIDTIDAMERGTAPTASYRYWLNH